MFLISTKPAWKKHKITDECLQAADSRHQKYIPLTEFHWAERLGDKTKEIKGDGDRVNLPSEIFQSYDTITLKVKISVLLPATEGGARSQVS